MDQIATESLFLLELLVDRVNLSNKCTCQIPPGETCVTFQFLDNSPLDICEADFNPQRTYEAEDDPVKSGKSCLFSLTPTQATECLEKFDITVTIWKKPRDDTEKYEVGNATIPIADLFSELIYAVQNTDGSVPTAKMINDDFDIINEEDDLLGTVSVYTRITCFGKLIITQFQMNLDDKSVLFKDNQGKSMYRYRKVSKKKNKRSSRDYGGDYSCGGNMGGSRGNGSECPTYPCGGSQNNFDGGYAGDSGGYGQLQGMNGSPYGMAPCQECGQIPNAPCLFSNQGNEMGMGGPMTPCIECGNIPNAPCLPPMSAGFSSLSNVPCEDCKNIPDAPCAIPPPPEPEPDPEGNYQEIFASMGGNTFKIRIHKNQDVEQVEPVSPNPSVTSPETTSPESKNGAKTSQKT